WRNGLLNELGSNQTITVCCIPRRHEVCRTLLREIVSPFVPGANAGTGTRSLDATLATTDAPALPSILEFAKMKPEKVLIKLAPDSGSFDRPMVENDPRVVPLSAGGDDDRAERRGRGNFRGGRGRIYKWFANQVSSLQFSDDALVIS
ncbi:hypothetical protein K0M31_009833, partial [Melipona bicolor]